MGFIQGYLESEASQYASMLAFSLLVSLLPLMLRVLTVFGLVAGTVGHQQRLVVLRQLLVDIVPANVQGDFNWDPPSWTQVRATALGGTDRTAPRQHGWQHQPG